MLFRSVPHIVSKLVIPDHLKYRFSFENWYFSNFKEFIIFFYFFRCNISEAAAFLIESSGFAIQILFMEFTEAVPLGQDSLCLPAEARGAGASLTGKSGELPFSLPAGYVYFSAIF